MTSKGDWSGIAGTRRGRSPPRGRSTLPRGFMLPFNHYRFPHINGKYALAFSEVPDAAVLDSERYRLWLIPRGKTFLLLKWMGNVRHNNW